MHKELNLSSHCHQSKKVNFAFLLQLGEEFDETTPDGREVMLITFENTLTYHNIVISSHRHDLILSYSQHFFKIWRYEQFTGEGDSDLWGREDCLRAEGQEGGTEEHQGDKNYDYYDVIDDYDYDN